MIAFPKELPLPLRDGYELEQVENIITTQMQSGRARQRVAFTKVPSFVNLSWIFTDQQAQYFEAWSSQLAKADWFTIRLKTPLGMQDYEARFTAAINGPALIGVSSWKCRAKVEIRDRPILPPGWAAILPDYILLSDIFDLAINREWPEA